MSSLKLAWVTFAPWTSWVSMCKLNQSSIKRLIFLKAFFAEPLKLARLLHRLFQSLRTDKFESPREYSQPEVQDRLDACRLWFVSARYYFSQHM